MQYGSRFNNMLKFGLLILGLGALGQAQLENATETQPAPIDGEVETAPTPINGNVEAAPIDGTVGAASIDDLAETAPIDGNMESAAVLFDRVRQAVRPYSSISQHVSLPISETSQCTDLQTQLPGKVDVESSNGYNAHLNYWSNRQNELMPTCFVSPANANDVSKAMKIIKQRQAPFTVKAGGHAPYASSNLEDGVVIDFVNLNTLDLAADQKSIDVGPGNRWKHVAAILDPIHKAAVGGRVGEIGVGGLTLGGGISWFGGRYGWAADNVIKYEVVLANGDIVTATKTQRSDLYWALRGGGAPNFGIVTKFKLNVIDQGDMWYKEAAFPPTITDDVVDLFCNTSLRAGTDPDPDAHPVMFAAHQPGVGVITQVLLFHAVPPPSSSQVPPIYGPFESVPTIPGTTKNATLSPGQMLTVYPDPSGFRKGWWDHTIAADTPAALKRIIANYGEWVETNFSNDPDVVAALLIQPITKPTIQSMQKNGGNPIPLSPNMRVPIKVTTYITWSDASKDNRINVAATALTSQIEAIAHQENAWNGGFIYLNYADRRQDPYSRYRPADIQRLRSVARQYDPQRTLRNLWKGYFKLPGL